jgi:hypothetical protein
VEILLIMGLFTILSFILAPPKRWYGNGRPAPLRTKVKTKEEYEAEGYTVTTLEELMK